MGLKTGVADGQENPWVNVEGMKFYEVQKYFTEVNYQFHPDPFYVNAAWWNGLPEEYRDIITECATKMGEYNDELIDKNSSAAKQTIVDSGCEVYEPSADELKAFQTAVQSVYDQCVTEGICTADEIQGDAGYRRKGISRNDQRLERPCYGKGERAACGLPSAVTGQWKKL